MTDQFKFVEFLAVENGFIIFAGREAAQCVQSACFVAWRLLSVLKIELPNHGRF